MAQIHIFILQFCVPTHHNNQLLKVFIHCSTSHDCRFLDLLLRLFTKVSQSLVQTLVYALLWLLPAVTQYSNLSRAFQKQFSKTRHPRSFHVLHYQQSPDRYTFRLNHHVAQNIRRPPRSRLPQFHSNYPSPSPRHPGPPLTHLQRNYNLRDPLLTSLGKSQCAHLSATYPHHDSISIILASPLRRTIQTAAHSFGPALVREEVKFVCLPALQEVSNLGADTGTDREELEAVVREMFEGEGLEFDVGKIDLGNVEEGWNSNVCFPTSTNCCLV